MRPVHGKTLILDRAPGAPDDGDPHFNPSAAPASVAVESFYSLSPSEIRLLAAGGAVRLRHEGDRLEFDVAARDEI